MQRTIEGGPERTAEPTRPRPSRGSAARLRLKPPRSLAALLGIVVLIGVTWALLVPPWQSPDELDHFAYAQSLAENFALPGKADRADDSSDEMSANAAVGANNTAFYPGSSPPDWSASDYAAYLSAEHHPDPPPRTNGGGPNGADPNPPLYYLVADVGYLLDYGGTAFGRLYAMRLIGVLILAATTLGGWLLAGEALGRRRLPQVVCAAVIGLLPMTTFMSTSVNPDGLLIALWTWALWLGARVIKRGAASWDPVGLCAVTAAAVMTKATSYALVGPVLLALLIGVLRRPAGERRKALNRVAPGVVVLAVPLIGWLYTAHTLGRAGINSVGAPAAHPFNLRQFLSYVWQFYLPRLPWLTPLKVTPGLPAYEIWLRQGFGQFGWLDVSEPGWLYPTAAAVLLALGLAGLYAVVRAIRRRDLTLLAFFALTLLALLLLLHMSAYLLLIGGYSGFLQGRYLLPGVGLLGLCAGLVVAALPGRARPLAGSLALVALLAVQVISMSSVLQAYYT